MKTNGPCAYNSVEFKLSTVATEQTTEAKRGRPATGYARTDEHDAGPSPRVRAFGFLACTKTTGVVPESDPDTSIAEKYRAKTMSLASQGRLFLDEGARLRRITAGEARELLDAGKPITVVTRGIKTERTETSSSSSDQEIQGFLGVHTAAGSTKSAMSNETIVVDYATSKVKTWGGLDWVEPGAGIPGVVELPPNGSRVTVSESIEQMFSKTNEESWRLLRRATSLTQVATSLSVRAREV